MSDMTPDSVRDFIRRELQRARLAQRSEAAIAIEEAMANRIASAWDADIEGHEQAERGLLNRIAILEARIEALERAAHAYLNWHRRQKTEPESPSDFLNEDLEEDRLGDALAAALAAEKKP